MNPLSISTNLLKSIFFSILSGITLCILTFILYKFDLGFYYIVTFIGIYTILLGITITILCQKNINELNKNHKKLVSTIRHDVKGILSPALLMADRILLNKSADDKIKQSAESIAHSIETAAEYLKENKNK